MLDNFQTLLIIVEKIVKIVLTIVRIIVKDLIFEKVRT